MKSALKPALDNLDSAMTRLESAIEQCLAKTGKTKAEPQLDLSARNEREVNKKVAARLDQTISRLEILLTED